MADNFSDVSSLVEAGGGIVYSSSSSGLSVSDILQEVTNVVDNHSRGWSASQQPAADGSSVVSSSDATRSAQMAAENSTDVSGQTGSAQMAAENSTDASSSISDSASHSTIRSENEAVELIQVIYTYNDVAENLPREAEEQQRDWLDRLMNGASENAVNAQRAGFWCLLWRNIKAFVVKPQFSSNETMLKCIDIIYISFVLQCIKNFPSSILIWCSLEFHLLVIILVRGLNHLCFYALPVLVLNAVVGAAVFQSMSNNGLHSKQNMNAISEMWVCVTVLGSMNLFFKFLVECLELHLSSPSTSFNVFDWPGFRWFNQLYIYMVMLHYSHLSEFYYNGSKENHFWFWSFVAYPSLALFGLQLHRLYREVCRIIRTVRALAHPTSENEPTDILNSDLMETVEYFASDSQPTVSDWLSTLYILNGVGVSIVFFIVLVYIKCVNTGIVRSLEFLELLNPLFLQSEYSPATDMLTQS